MSIFNVHQPSQGIQGNPGSGVPTGGSTNDLLSKIDGTDRNTQWVRPGVYAEVSDPAAPASGAVVYAKNVGGKAALMVRFPTGAVQQIKIEA